MTKQVIPAEAVEAAAKVLFKAQTFNDWESLDPKIRPIWLSKASAALEAAAPYMQRHFREGLDALDMGPRSVWHDAVSEAYVDGALSLEQASVMWNKNPYESDQ